MTRDFKIGLMSGVVLAFVALIWVVTRPTLSPQARMLGPRSGSAQEQPVADPIRQAASPIRRPEPQTPPEAQAPARTPSPTLPEPAEPAPAQPAPAPDSPTARIDSTVYEKDEKIKTTRFHIVLKDETLSSISQKYYGAPNQWQKIVEANRDTIKNPNKISPGTKLIIPD